MKIDFQIRFAKEEDAEAIAEIGVVTWQNAYRGQIPKSYLQSLSVKDKVEHRRKEITSPKSIERYLVAEEGQQVIGYCHAGPARSSGKETGELYSIYVRPEKQNKGAGSALMGAALQYLKDHNFLKAILWVLETNSRTRSWYESKGWRLEGSKKSEPKNGFELNEIQYEIDLK